MTIRLPKQITPYPDRDLDCQGALEDTFRNVLSLAEASGWSNVETATALQKLAFRHLEASSAFSYQITMPGQWPSRPKTGTGMNLKRDLMSLGIEKREAVFAVQTISKAMANTPIFIYPGPGFTVTARPA